MVLEQSLEGLHLFDIKTHCGKECPLNKTCLKHSPLINQYILEKVSRTIGLRFWSSVLGFHGT